MLDVQHLREWLQYIATANNPDSDATPEDLVIAANRALAGEPCDRNVTIHECRCGAKAKELHTCPFKSDINGDNESLCNCCEECEYQCAMDI